MLIDQCPMDKGLESPWTEQQPLVDFLLNIYQDTHRKSPYQQLANWLFRLLVVPNFRSYC